jgi:hypothetical protein
MERAKERFKRAKQVPYSYGAMTAAYTAFWDAIQSRSKAAEHLAVRIAIFTIDAANDILLNHKNAKPHTRDKAEYIVKTLRGFYNNKPMIIG